MTSQWGGSIPATCLSPFRVFRWSLSLSVCPTSFVCLYVFNSLSPRQTNVSVLFGSKQKRRRRRRRRGGGEKWLDIQTSCKKTLTMETSLSSSVAPYCHSIKHFVTSLCKQKRFVLFVCLFRLTWIEVGDSRGERKVAGGHDALIAKLIARRKTHAEGRCILGLEGGGALEKALSSPWIWLPSVLPFPVPCADWWGRWQGFLEGRGWGVMVGRRMQLVESNVKKGRGSSNGRTRKWQR